MSYDTLFPALPDEARCWTYVADRPLSDAQQEDLMERLRTFFGDWTSHGRAVRGEATLVDDQILILAAVVPEGDLSGCGIDKSVHIVEERARAQGYSWLSPLLIVWRGADGTIRHGPRSEFRTLVQEGTVDGTTSVFDLSIETVGDLRDGRLERPAGQSWHARVFRLAEPTP